MAGEFLPVYLLILMLYHFVYKQGGFMKKIFAIGALICVNCAANAQNVFDGNPLYHPNQGRFYNVLTPVEFDTNLELYKMRDVFGYGITDNFSVMIETSGSYDSSDNPEFGKWAWNDLAVGFDWSIAQQGEYHSEIYGRGQQIYNTKHHLETIAYNWTLGARVGRMTDVWTIAGVVELDYLNDDMPHDDYDAWAMTVGLMGQYILDQKWNVVAKMMFDFDLFDKYYDGERLVAGVQMNYNIDSTKYIGVYTTKDVIHNFDNAPMAFGVLFGIDF